MADASELDRATIDEIDGIETEYILRKERVKNLVMPSRHLGGLVIPQLEPLDELEFSLVYSSSHGGRIEEARTLRARVVIPDSSLVYVMEDSYMSNSWRGHQLNLATLSSGNLTKGIVAQGCQPAIDLSGEDFKTLDFTHYPRAVYGRIMANDVQFFPVPSVY